MMVRKEHAQTCMNSRTGCTERKAYDGYFFFLWRCCGVIADFIHTFTFCKDEFNSSAGDWTTDCTSASHQQKKKSVLFFVFYHYVRFREAGVRRVQLCIKRRGLCVFGLQKSLCALYRGGFVDADVGSFLWPQC